MRIAFPFDGQYESLGIGYLASVARQAGNLVDFVPIRIGDYITGYRRSSERLIAQATQAVLLTRPDVVAFSLMSPSAGVMADVARAVGARGVPTIAGGPHATAEPRISLEEGRFAGVVRGEADAVFLEALDSTRDGGEAPPWLDTTDHVTVEMPPKAELDTLPFPAKDLFFRHVPSAVRDYTVITSRGCPYRCSFCAGAHRVGRPTYRRRSPENVIDELRWAKTQFSPRSVYILDDIFTVQKPWLDRFLSLYAEQVALPFHALTHPLHLDVDTAWALKRAGCFALRMGIQTLTPSVRRRLNRTESNADIEAAIDAAVAAGIRLEVDHMLDLPGETVDDVTNALEFYERHRPDAIRVYWLTPFPGSPWFEEVEKLGLLLPKVVQNMRRGRGYGAHSYLFPQVGVGDRRWLGSHFMLAFLPHLPRPLRKLLRRVEAHRWFNIPSFFILVGLSRIPFLLRRGDRVGEGHLLRLVSRLRF